MKRILPIVVVLFFFSIISYARSIDSTEIVGVVEGFIELNYEGKEVLVIKSIESINESDDSYLAVVKLNPQGWILVSTDDVSEPVLGYSFDSDFDADRFHVNDGFKFVIKGYEEKIKLLKENNAESNPEWERLKKKEKLKSETTSVAPLIQVEWNQDAGWNSSAPEDPNGPGGHAYVGCVAVAMGQAMTVFKYPQKPVGKKTYSHPTYGTLSVNYDTYGDYNWSGMITNTPNEDIADFLYHCAVSVEMDFDSDGSGAITKHTVYSLKNYFQYAPTVRSYERVSDTEEWKEILNQELLEGRPLIYSGDADDGKAGHAFNIDGVSAGGFYHLNWGWGGYNNGYFNIDNLAPGSNDFTKNQAAIVGIRPPISAPTDIDLSNTEILEGLPVGTTVGEIIVESEVDDNVYTFQLRGKLNIFGEYGSVNFYEEDGLLKTKETFEYIEGEDNEEYVEIVVSDQNGNELAKSFYIKILKDPDDDVSIQEVTNSDEIFYNYQIQEIHFNTNSTLERIVKVYDLSGKKYINKELKGNNLNVSNLPHGIFVVVWQDVLSGQYFSFKFVRN